MAAAAATSGADPKPDTSREKWYTSAAALSVGIICLVFGLPLWWKTTNVYRADMPYSSIDELASRKLTVGLNLELVLVNTRSKDDLLSLEAAVKSALRDTSSDDAITTTFHVSVREVQEVERSALSSQTSDVTVVEKDLAKHNDVSEKYSFYVVPDHLLSGLSLPLLGTKRIGFLRHAADQQVTVQLIKSMLEAAVNEASISKTYEVAAGHSAAEKTDKDHVRAMRSSPSYDIVFSLLVADPGQSNVRWNFRKAMRDYLLPLKDVLSDYVTLTFKSQVLYYTGLAVETKKDNETNEHYLLSTDLPHLINPVESKLGSFVTKSPTLNFLVYVPRPSEHPLFIRSPSGAKAAVNAFLSPRWGGFAICNDDAMIDVTTGNGSGSSLKEVNMKVVLEVLLPQLRLLLGIQQVLLPPGMLASVAGSSVVTSWEIDSWLRARTVENLVQCTRTLNSLTQLVDKIRNMVINDDIGSEVTNAVNAALRSHSELAASRLSSAFLESQRAVVSSEKAFFDPSLLELLYFPEDQKFAIYIPLFLPIGLPIVASTLSALKWIFRRQAKEKAE